MNENKISVIICTYNSENTIGDTLKSTFSSSCKDFEVIIVDDCSTDNTVSICKNFPVKIIELKENKGPAFARNTGVKNSKNDILIFLDSDVTFSPNLFNSMLTYMKNDPRIAGVGTFSSPIPLNQNFYSQYFALKEHRRLLGLFNGKGQDGTNFICTRCGCLKKSVFKDIGGFNESYRKPSIEDHEFSMRMKNKYMILYDKTLFNSHHFPNTFLKICRRYYRNSSEMIQLNLKNKIKKDASFRKDAYALLLINFSIILFIIGIFFKPLFLIWLITFLMAILVQRDLFIDFYKSDGLRFMIKGCFFYCLFSILITMGLISGFLESIKCQFDTNSKNHVSEIF